MMTKIKIFNNIYDFLSNFNEKFSETIPELKYYLEEFNKRVHIGETPKQKDYILKTFALAYNYYAYIEADVNRFGNIHIIVFQANKSEIGNAWVEEGEIEFMNDMEKYGKELQEMMKNE